MKFKKQIFLLIFGSLALYSSFIVISDFSIVYKEISEFKVNYLPIIFLLIPIGWLVFFIRWHLLMKNSNLSPPLKENFKVYSPDKIERYISNIENSSQNTYNLLEGTLAWAGAKSGKLILSKNEHALNDIIAKLVRELNVIAVLKNINIHFSQISEINVFCDARIITIILRNLLSNAIKFTDYGGEINIYFEENDLEVLVSVTDNGNGIAPDFLPKLFKMTSINNAEGAGNEKGTGIGLIICKELIEKHEGKIWVTSELGIGSNFKFTIPKQLGVNT